MSEIVKSEYNALGEDNNYKTHFFKTSADQVVGLGRMKSTSYSVGDVVYTDNNLQVALKCTTAGTTSDSELDISTANIGDSVADGGCVWQVCNRTSDVTSVNGEVGDVQLQFLPVGTIIAYAGNTVPSGYLDCSGASLSPSTYTNLFGVIGTTYGGDGSTTFNLPNLNNNSFLEGSNTAGIVNNAGLPNLYGTHGVLLHGIGYTAVGGCTGVFQSGANENTYRSSGNPVANADYSPTLIFNASGYNSIYGNSETVQPKSVTVKYCIKY